MSVNNHNFFEIQDDFNQNYNNWTFNNVFKRKGVQAVCGTLKRKYELNEEEKKYPPIVYKVSAYPDRTNEHESMILKKCNGLKTHSKHFVGLYDSKICKVPNKFIEDNCKKVCKCENCIAERLKKIDLTLYTKDKNSQDRLVLYIEYVSNIHLKHAIRTNDDHLSVCQLIMSLAAIQQGIEHCGFIHYDLHIDNILLKHVEPNSYFAYKFKDGSMTLTPTRGFYPVFIDFGTSFIHDYIDKNNNYNCKTPMINAHHGLQPTVYDKFVDAHQLIISSLFELEKISDKFHHISTQFMHYFRHVNIFRETGWKHLPFDIFEILLDKILDEYPYLEDDYPIMSTRQSELFDLLGLRITLPFKTITKQDLETLVKRHKVKKKLKDEQLTHCLAISFKEWIIQLHQVHNFINKNTDKNCDIVDDKIYYIIREIVECPTKEECKNITQKYKFNSKCNIEKIWYLTNDIAMILSHYYHQYLKTHEQIIEEQYKNVFFKTIFQMIHFFQQNVPVRPINNNAIVYCFDGINETQKKLEMDFSDYKPGKKWIETKCNEIFKND